MSDRALDTVARILALANFDLRQRNVAVELEGPVIEAALEALVIELDSRSMADAALTLVQELGERLCVLTRRVTELEDQTQTVGDIEDRIEPSTRVQGDL